MKILIINPNTSVEMSKTIDVTAKRYASPGTEITTLNPSDGPDYIANAYDRAQQAPKVVELVEKNKMNYDYFVIACGSDPGLDACRIVTRKVIGIGEAAIMTACAAANRFSFLSTTVESAIEVPLRLHALGINMNRCASARPVGTSDEIVHNRHQLLDVYYETGQKCIEDGAGALILACAGMSDIKEYLEQRLKIPIISGVISAVKIIEQFPDLPC
ncbi:aspartate/glutamate racemase family protein [Chloroflexota bacterium]